MTPIRRTAKFCILVQTASTGNERKVQSVPCSSLLLPLAAQNHPAAIHNYNPQLHHYRETALHMKDFTNVTVVRKANSYFDGKVTSRTVLFASGEKKTLGIMMPGTYRFDTAKKELMEIQGGIVEVLLPGDSAWKTFKEGESFEVPAHAEFDIKAVTVADYCCSYLD